MITQNYKITGMTCSSCEAKVKEALESLAQVNKVEVSKDTQSATIELHEAVSIATMQAVLTSKYQISAMPSMLQETAEDSWFVTYRPILLIFFYLSLVTVLIQVSNSNFHWMDSMNYFMAGFFLVFSFFKLLNLKGFAESYVMYDVVARKFPLWAYLYAFIEFSLGLAYVTDFYPILTNGVTFLVMGVSLIGVLQSVLNKKKIQCACLGAIFQLPMSTVTILEDALMLLMSGIMLINYI